MSDDPAAANGDGGGKKKKGAAKQQPQFAKDDQGNLILPPDMPEIDVVTWQVRGFLIIIAFTAQAPSILIAY